MTIAQFISLLLDIGLGASALTLASRLTSKVQDHEKRIGVLEKQRA